MYLFELFDDGPLDVTDDIKESILDILTPMVAQKVPFVTIQQILDKVGQLRTGISVDRNLIMTLLDPDKIKIVDKIEGDRVYLKDADAPNRDVGQDNEQKEKDHVNKMAQQQAKKAINKDDGAGGPL